MKPKIIKGEYYSDSRGTLFYNNDFDASEIKRVYVIENLDIDLKRAWQGHAIEQRWFSALTGSFKIRLVPIDNWSSPSKDLEIIDSVLESNSLDILHIPNGYATSIQSLEKDSKLLVMADYLLGEIKDEYRFSSDYFECE